MRHHDYDDSQLWSVAGRFAHLIYSPHGSIEGVLIDTDGTPTQFTFDRDQANGAQAAAFGRLRAGQQLVIEGVIEEAPHKDQAAHFVYRFERLASVGGHDVPDMSEEVEVTGKVVRFNYARHGQPNGYVLDTGDFVHTKPNGFRRLGLGVGDKVVAVGAAQPLMTGKGRLVAAVSVNGQALQA